MIAVPKSIIIVFDVGGPMLRERPFDAAARGPADAVFQARKAERQCR